MKGLRRYNLLVDLDGVLADFDHGFKSYCGSTLSMRETDEEVAWEAIKRTPNFWKRLRPMPGALAFWESIAPFNPCILTSPSTHDTDRAVVEKRAWVDEWLGKGTPIFFRRAKRKQDLASPDAILIDDWEPNIVNWRKAGGHGILHSSFERTWSDLNRIALTEDVHAYIRNGA